jgi:hypothetical protein
MQSNFGDDFPLLFDGDLQKDSRASSASDCVALQGGPVKGAPCGRVAVAMARAPPLTVPPFQAVSGSYRP